MVILHGPGGSRLDLPTANFVLIGENALTISERDFTLGTEKTVAVVPYSTQIWAEFQDKASS